MVKIATPISHLFHDHRSALRIMEASDVLEGRDHTHEIQQEAQELFHFELSALNEWETQERHWVKSIIDQRPHLQLISFHLASCCSAPVLENGMFKAGGKTFSKDELLQHAASNIGWLKQMLGFRNMLIAVENNNHYPTPAYEHITEAEFITKVVEETSINFLFDLAHAKITAANKGIPYEKYFSTLPMKRAVQIHISQWATKESGLAFDAHQELTAETMQEAVDVAKSFGISYATIEYYRDTEKLLSAIGECRSILKGEKKS